MLKQFHDQEGGIGHAIGPMLAHKILRDGFHQLTIFKYAHNYVKKYHICQNLARREEKSNLCL